MAESMQNHAFGKKSGRIWNLTDWIILTVGMIVAGLCVIPRLFGIWPYEVRTGSMMPLFAPGTICFVDKNTDTDTLEAGDIIAFSIGKENLITHRIVEVCENGFRTRGDANETEDPFVVQKDQVIGKNIMAVPVLGFVIRQMKKPVAIASSVFYFIARCLGQNKAEKERLAEVIQIESARNERQKHTDGRRKYIGKKP